jgi:hypothetical protein
LKRLVFIALLFLSVSILPLQTKAEFKVPATKETEQWKVELLVSSNDKNLAQGEKGKYEVYSLLVTNKKGIAHKVYVGAFRNEQGTSLMYGLAPQMKSDKMTKGQTFRFTNFPVKAGTNKLEFVITWEDEPITFTDGKKAPGPSRTYKESIVFEPVN